MKFGWVVAMCSAGALSALAEKPTLTWKPPPAGDDDRPVIRELVVAPQGSDYAFKIEFTKEPFGDACKNRCASATLFIDTDNNKGTGLKLKDTKAPETGADLAITVQGTRELRGSETQPIVKVKVKQFAEDATSVDQGASLAELDPKHDPDRVLADGTSVYLLVDTNIGNIPQGAKMRVVYHPPDQKPLVGLATGMSAPGANRIEMFKDGKLSNPVNPGAKKPKKPDYEKY